MRASIEYEPGHLSSSSGNKYGSLGMKEPITKENMLLRGSKLKNTTFVEGVVMYAGHDTKVREVFLVSGGFPNFFAYFLLLIFNICSPLL